MKTLLDYTVNTQSKEYKRKQIMKTVKSDTVAGVCFMLGLLALLIFTLLYG